MSSTFAAAVEALLVATPEPPAADADPAEILIAAERAIAVRGPLVELLQKMAPAEGTSPEAGVAERFAIIIERDARWTAAMTRAKHELSGRMRGARRFRTAY